MAAIIACADYILLTNGTDAGLVHYSAPKEFRRLPIPSFQAASRGDPSQASLARKKGAGTEKPQDGGAASKTNAAEIGAGADAQDSIPAAEIKGDVGFDNNSSSAGKAQQNYVRALAISHTGSHVALCDDRKYLHVFQVASSGQVSIVSSRCTARRCTDVCFSPDDSLVLVADKSGDAYSFPTLCQDQNPDDKDGNEDDKDLHSAEQAGNSEGQTEEDGRGDVDSKEAVLSEGDKLEVEVEDEDDFERQRGSGEGTLILGHLSMLLGVRLVDNGQLVVTCDRDEKIRVSNFPDAYNIHSYCLGHTEFVIDLAYDEANKILLSASGDCTVRAWSLDGTQVCQRNILKDLPQELHPKAAPAPAADGSDQGNSQPSNEHRTSIRKMSYCAECNLLFVALERSPHILVYRLDIEQPSSAGCQTSLHLMTVLRGRSALDHSQAPEKPDLSRASATGDATVVSTPETAVAGGESREASVAGLCAQGSVLWVLRRQQEKLWLTAHAFCLKQSQELQISEIASESNESQILKTVSEQIGFLTVLPDAEDLLPFLWKYSFQDDFKLQCNLKRAQPERKEGEHNRKGRSRKKAKRGEKGR